MNTDPQLQALVDKEAIRELNARYNYAMDARDGETFKTFLTSDVVGGRYGTDIRVEGLDAFVEMSIGFPVEGRHMTSDWSVTIDGDTAEQKLYCLYMDMQPPWEVSMFGMYHDKLVRTPDGWRFCERVFQPFFLRESEQVLSNAPSQ